MKSYIKGTITGIIIGAAVCSSTAFAENDISVVIDGEQVAFDVPPQIIEERTFVPIRAIFEALGADVQWWDTTKTVYAKKPLGGNLEKTVTLAIGEKTMTVSERNVYRDSIKTLNETRVELDVPAQIVGDRTLVPVRAISESLDCEVKWDGDERKVIIISSPEKVIGTATINEMRCLIDYQPIDFVNIDGYTYINVKDLDSYSFDLTEGNGDIYVTYNKDKLPLLIDEYKGDLIKPQFRGYYDHQWYHSITDLWREPLYGKEFDVFASGRSVYMNGEEVPSKNVNGNIYVQAEEFERYGYVMWTEKGYRLIGDYSTTVNTLKIDLSHETKGANFSDFPSDYTGLANFGYQHHNYDTSGYGHYKDGKKNGYGYLMCLYMQAPVGTLYEAGEYEDNKLKNGIIIKNILESDGRYILTYEVNNFEETQLYPKEMAE